MNSSDVIVAKKNLVMGAVRGYRYEQLRPFVVSLKRSGFEGDLVLLWNGMEEETLEQLRAQGVKLFHFPYRGGALNSWSRFWPKLAGIVRGLGNSPPARAIYKAILPMQTARFFHYRDFLKRHQNEYDKVLLTDVRDVIFQGDPFVDLGEGVFAFEESAELKLADERACNAMWVEAMFGAEAVARIGHHPILCSGTIMGEVDALADFIGKLEGALGGARDVSIGGSDQGLHNYYCRLIDPKAVTVCRNGEGPILTMVPVLKEGVDFTVGASTEVYGSKGNLVPVLHQYDRFADLSLRLLARLAPP